MTTVGIFTRMPMRRVQKEFVRALLGNWGSSQVGSSPKGGTSAVGQSAASLSGHSLLSSFAAAHPPITSSTVHILLRRQVHTSPPTCGLSLPAIAVPADASKADHVLLRQQVLTPKAPPSPLPPTPEEMQQVDLVRHQEELILKRLEEEGQQNPTASPAQIEDSLPRYPDLTTGGFVRFADYVGTGVFAKTGSLTAMAAGMDMLGTVIVGTITAVGGGTFRDILIARDEHGRSKRAFWMDEPEYLYISLFASIGTFFLWNTLAPILHLDESDAWLFWLDSFGIGAFCSIGCMHGIRAGLPWLVCALCGMMTSTFGGLTRDLLTNRPVRILHSHSELYATTAFCGASAYFWSRKMGASYATRVLAAFSTAIGLRYIAWNNQVALPTVAKVYSTQEVKWSMMSEDERAAALPKTAHSSGVEALHKREFERIRTFMTNSVPKASGTPADGPSERTRAA